MKLKKLLAAVVSGALALSAMAVSSLPVSAADVTLPTSGWIAYSELEKYESLTITYSPELVSSCSTGSSHAHNSGETYCTWAKAIFIGNVADENFKASDAKKYGWYQPDNIAAASSGADAASTSATIQVSDIISSFTSDSDWGSNTLTQVQVSAWNATVTGVVGTPKAGGGDPIPPTPAGGEAKITFPTGEISLDVIDASTWGQSGLTKAAQITQDANFDGVTYGTTTFAEFKNAYSKITLDGITYKNNSLDVDASKFAVSIFAQGGNWSIWKAKDVGTLDSISSSVSVNVADLFGDASDTAEIQKIGFQITCKGGTDVPAIESMALGDKVTVNSASTPKPPTPPTPDESTVLWTGTQELGVWANSVQIGADKFADLKDGDVIKVTFDLGASANQISFKYGAEGWPALTGAEYIDVTASPYSYTIADGDAEKVIANGLIVGGQNLTITKVELISNGGGDVGVCTHEYGDYMKDSAGHWKVCTKCGEATAKEAHTFGADNVCTVCGYKNTVVTPDPVVPVIPTVPSIPDVGAPVIPFNNFNPNKGSSDPTISGSSDKSGWSAVESEISGAADGGKVSVDMNKSTKLPKSVVSAIEDTDVDLVLTMSNGIKWTINGKNVDNAKTVDMGVTTNTHNIPTDVIKAINGKSYSRQLSLDHNGSFGFTATMTISLGKVNNGLYANLYYYNPDSKELEFVDCGLIENGSANLVFRHASDYAIVIDEEPLGAYDDVSAAAGITSSDDTVGTNSAVYPVAIIVIAALGIAVGKKFSRQK